MQEDPTGAPRDPRPSPPGHWVLTERWNDLLFAHWPVPASSLAALIPEGLQVDSFQGSAWLGIMPFWMDRVRVHGLPPILGARSFPDLSLRTYVLEKRTGAPGVYCLSLDSSNLLAVAAGRTIYRLPYHWAEMRLRQRTEREFSFYSSRRFAVAAGGLQGSLPRSGPVGKAGRVPRGHPRVLPHGALLPLLVQWSWANHPDQPAPRLLASGRR